MLCVYNENETRINYNVRSQSIQIKLCKSQKKRRDAITTLPISWINSEMKKF